MKKYLLSTLALILMAPAAAAQTPLRLNSQTRSVAAYQGLALVTRQVNLPALQPGSYEVQLQDLPLDLNANSLSISGSGQARIRIHHLQLQPPLNPESQDPELKALEKQVNEVQAQLDRVGSGEELNQVHQKLLNTFQQQLSAQAQAKEDRRALSVRDWQLAMDFARSHQGQILDSQLTLKQQKSALGKQLKQLRQQLQELQQARRPKQQASLFISVDSAGSAQLLVSYLIGNVSWSPAYEARLDSASKKLRLVYQGDLSQRSGEDWQQVRLSLSTATPVLNQRPPDALRWPVGPPEMAKSRPAPAAPMAQRLRSEAEALEDSYADSELVNYAQSEVAQTGLSVRFQLPEAQNVPSSTQTRRLAMAIREFSYNPAYKIVPRQSKLAFLEAQIKNESELPLLPGPMRTYIGPEFTGVSPIELVRPGQSVRLNFGVDQGIKVDWKELSRSKRSTGVLQDKEELTVVYQAEITNYKQEPAPLRILEPAARPANDQIEVKLMQAVPPVSETSDEGLLTWYLTAQPWEKKTLQLTYRIIYPKDMPVVF